MTWYDMVSATVTGGLHGTNTWEPPETLTTERVTVTGTQSYNGGFNTLASSLGSNTSNTDMALKKARAQTKQTVDLQRLS